MKKVFLCLLCVFLLTGCESYSKDDLDKAYKDGYSEGQSDGYNKGQESGYESAKEAYIGDYDRGYEKGLEAGHDDGFEDGFNTGHSEGYNTGYDNGYEKGYEKGWEDCTSFITNYFTQSADTVDDSLEKTCEATDAANIRAAYAEVVTYYIDSGDALKTITVTAEQTKAGWQTDPPPCLSYMGKDKVEYYYYAASVRGYIVGIEIHEDGSATPSVTAIE